MRTILQEEGTIHYNITIWYTSLFLCLKQIKIRAAKAAVDEEWEKLEKIPAWDVTKVRKKGDRWSKKERQKSSFCLTDGHLSFEECRIGDKSTKNTKVKLYSEAISLKMILDLMQYLQNKDHQHHKLRQQKSWISSPDCQDAQDKQLIAVSAYTQVKMEDASKLLKIPKIACPDIWVRLPRHKWPKIMAQHGRPSRSSRTKSLWSSCGRTMMGKAIWENPIEARLGGGFQLGRLIRTPLKKYSNLCMWMTSNWMERNKTLIRCGQYSMKKSTWENQHPFPWSWKPGVYSKTMWNKQRYCWHLQNHVWIQNFRRSNWKNTMLGKPAYLFVVRWHARWCKEICGAILWVGKQDDTQELYKVSTPCIVQRRKMKSVGDLCQKYALKLSWNAYTWHVLEDLIFYGQWTNLHDRLRTGPSLWQTTESIDILHPSHMWI